MTIKWITLVYTLCLLTILVMVDRGGYETMRYLSAWVHTIPYGDKMGHFLLMGLLAFTVNLSLKGEKFTLSRFSVLKGSFIVFIIVTLEEYSQIFFTERTFDLGDLMSDYLGIFLFGQGANYLLCRKLAFIGQKS